MSAPHQTERYTAEILNAAWMVRHYARGGRLPSLGCGKRRQAAIRQLGLVVRRAFNESEDFEALLTAVYHGLRPNEDPPF